jgi:serine/threonine-protein kinase
VKATLTLLAAAALMLLAWLGSGYIEANRAGTVKREAAHGAETAGMRAAEALAAHVRELKLEAQNAAANPRLVAALRGNADAATLQDLFRTEEWWEPYRNAFRVYAVAFEGDKLDVIEGMKTAEFASDLIIREARERKEAVAEVVMGKGWPYAAAAAVVELPGRAIPAVLVLARPIDEAAVRKLAEKARGGVLLSDGQRAVIEAGPEPERELLRAAVGSETRGPIYEGKDGSWAAAVSPLVPGLWLWTYASGAAAAHDAESSATALKGGLWAAASLGAIIVLFFGLRRKQPAVVEGPAGELVADAPDVDTRTVGGVFRSRPNLGPGAAGTGSQRAPRTGEELAATERHEGGPRATADGVRTVSFGRYRLVDLLGEGGMAQVYTAVTFGAEGFRRTFVVKRLRAELSRDPAVVAQFIDEANLGSTLVHSNIIPVFDFGKVGDEYYLAQEYILGRDLGRLVARSIETLQRPLPATATLFAAAETLRALEYAHTKLGESGRSMGIVHRDVSPSNILVSARGEVKLFDFGIVKAEGRVTKTQHGVVKGNVSFMSPEQARGINIDARADLFSLGLVIFYCLTGEVLYKGQTTYDLLVKAATGPGDDELARIAALPAPCAEIVRKTLEVDPTRRYQTAGEFSAALAPHVAGGAAEAGALMTTMFGDDFRAEEARFAAAIPSSERALDAGAPRDHLNRRPS